MEKVNLAQWIAQHAKLGVYVLEKDGVLWTDVSSAARILQRTRQRIGQLISDGVLHSIAHRNTALVKIAQVSEYALTHAYLAQQEKRNTNAQSAKEVL